MLSSTAESANAPVSQENKAKPSSNVPIAAAKSGKSMDRSSAPHNDAAPTPANTPATASFAAPVAASQQQFQQLLQNAMSQSQEASKSGGASSSAGNGKASKGAAAGGEMDATAMRKMIAENPSLLAAMQGQFNELVGASSGYIESLPRVVKNRVRALEKLQDEASKMDYQFRMEVLELEKKFAAMHAPLRQKRAEIVQGIVEPAKVEPEEGEETDDEEPEEPSLPVDCKGIPEFWLTCFKNSPVLEAMIAEHDEGALAYLEDVRVAFLDGNPGFRVEFAFAEGNPYFTDRLLTKSFFLEDKPEYEDIVYDHSEASEIHWQAGKNVTVVVETRKQRHKATNKTRVIKRTTPRESFFNFFKSVEEYVSVLGGKGRSGEDDEDEEEDEEEHEENMLADRARQEYEIGEHIKNEIVPRAIDWFTGEATADYGDEDYDDDEDDDEFDDEDDEDDEDDDDSESDEDEDDEPKQGKPAKTGAAATGDKPPECKQQ